MSDSPHPAFSRLSLATLLYNLAVIAWGAFVRATGSGAGCAEHWPLCNGEIIPRTERLDTLIELTHRVTSGLALVLVVVLVVAARRTFSAGHLARRAAWASLGFMVVEAGLGAALVLLALVGENSSLARAGVMALHLVNTFLLLAALAITHRAGRGHTGRPWRAHPSIALPWGLGTFGLVLLGALGAVTALGDTLFPAQSMADGLAQDLSPTAHLLVRVRALHPLMAMLLGVYLIVLGHVLRRHLGDASVTRGATAVLLLYLTQVGVGLWNLWLLAPIPLQLVHLVLADLVWIAWIWLGCAAGTALPAERWRRGEGATTEHRAPETVGLAR